MRDCVLTLIGISAYHLYELSSQEQSYDNLHSPHTHTHTPAPVLCLQLLFEDQCLQWISWGWPCVCLGTRTEKQELHPSQLIFVLKVRFVCLKAVRNRILVCLFINKEMNKVSSWIISSTKSSVVKFSLVLSLLKIQQPSIDLCLYTNHLFNLNCTTVNEYKSQFLPSGPVLQKYPSTLFSFFFNWKTMVLTCVDTLLSKQLTPCILATTTERGSRRGLCHYETMWLENVSKQEQQKGGTTWLRERLDPVRLYYEGQFLFRVLKHWCVYVCFNGKC